MAKAAELFELIYVKCLTSRRRVASSETIDIAERVEIFEMIFRRIRPIPYRIHTYWFFSD